ncbi:branched-subunit amino acid transport protein AzlD [Aequitasia blattaphilus]|uniref:AzlD domain-containing protein n=1 Tax=Aequitasia blattaphilus TaxID=2949332 RepID=A0ABT1ECB9_9FIRM|nr:AzlD domain-containing protein [Aequitasia blattaphilus]MCP1103470.1 AzlD domain-containing protein [Aequitasia blattaphilus]MCR8616110.1 AzlD domain-containing protein [Aequitasia blattaphilus]
MRVNALLSFVIILLVALTTFATRVAPFLLFPKGKPIPPTVKYLGDVLTPSIIGLLVIYCLRNVSLTSHPFGLPEVIGVLITGALHVWKRNTLLSIGVGTISYMILVQMVF